MPDFGRVVAQTQHDMYHTYTVDEHTIRAIGILSRIESGALKEDHPLSVHVIKEVLSRRVLYGQALGPHRHPGLQCGRESVLPATRQRARSGRPSAATSGRSRRRNTATS